MDVELDGEDGTAACFLDMFCSLFLMAYAQRPGVPPRTEPSALAVGEMPGQVELLLPCSSILEAIVPVAKNG